MAKQIESNSINVPTVTHNTMKEYMAIAREQTIALMMHGTFGIGKSEIVKQFAMTQAKAMKLEYSEDLRDVNNEKKFVAIVINLHQFDVSGFWLPVFVDGKYDQMINDMFPLKGNGIIFFDEINLAPNMVQANAYQFILDRRLGKYTVPAGYSVFAAGNTVTDGAHIHEMATPLKNRMMHFKLNPPTAQEWADNYAIAHGVDQRVINFLLWKEDYVHKYDPEITENVFGIPTPRSWAFTSRVIKGVTDEKSLSNLVGANVGTEVARQFVSFVKMSQEIDIAKIFKAGKMEVPTEIDQIYALMSAIIAYYTKKTEEVVTLVKLAQLMKSEHTIILLKQAKGFVPTFIADLKAKDDALFSAISKKYIKLLI